MSGGMRWMSEFFTFMGCGESLVGADEDGWECRILRSEE